MRVRFYGYGILVLGLTAFFASCKAPTSSPSSPSKAWVVSTLAGSGAEGFENGTGAEAKFKYPRGVAVDSDGNVYVAESGNDRIRKITAAGEVTTLAGSTAGFKNATGAEAKFNDPEAVAVDSDGNVYVADADNHRIRKITPGGEVTTLAGTGAGGQFSYPRGVAVDSDGNVYVADSGNHRIRKITAGGVVTTLAGGQLSSPYSVAVDSEGNVYVADLDNNRIRKITEGGVVTTLAGGKEGGYKDDAGTAAKFNAPIGVAVDSEGNVYVADELNHCIRKITAGGVVTTLAGGTMGYKNGTGAEAQFFDPYDVAVNSEGNIYVADSGNHRIRKIEYKVP